MKAIIFGINGQDGYYLQRTFEENNAEVIGVSRALTNYLQGNVADFSFVDELVQKHKPDYILHLAANSSTRHDVLFENHETIATGTLNILEAVKRHQPGCKVFITGSGVQFENRGLPIKESDAFQASSPYAIARIQSVYAARYYRSLGIPVYVGYLFHHESPLRKKNHISKMIVDTVQRIAQGSTEKIKIGDPSVQKEWGFAGDIAEGIITLLNQYDIFEAAIGTGKSYSIYEWIKACCRLIGEECDHHIETDSAFSKAEYNVLVSDPSTIFNLGWQPKVDFYQLAALMMDSK